MDERLREALSAMLDDQADELSVRRVLSHPEQEKVRDQWQRWQAVRDLMHDGVSGDLVDVSAQVRQSLAGGGHVAMESAEVGRHIDRRWHWSAVAMVLAGLVVGFGVGAGWGVGDRDKMVAVYVERPPVEQAVANAADAEVTVPEVALQGLDDAQREQLSRYLLEHAQHNSVAAGRGAVGYARLASVSAQAY